MKTVPKSKITELLDLWTREATVYAPLRNGAIVGFGRWSETAKEDLAMEVISTHLSPKNLLFPQTEPLYRFKCPGESLEIEKIEPLLPNSGPCLAVGVRACDVRAFQLLDAVFLTRGFVDTNYQARRENLTIVGMACQQPLDTCFCASLGVDAVAVEGSDAVLYDLGDCFGIEARTAKGEKLLQDSEALLVEKEVSKPQPASFELSLDLSGVREQLAVMFEHLLWEKLSRRCLGCGTCTYVCPTCHCFDIQGKVWGEEGYRFRCWDSCMYAEYTLMAGGHNPRPTKKERVRQRFMHKLRYFPERYGEFLCTGCGRCLQHCPVGLDIMEVARLVQQEIALRTAGEPTGEVKAEGEERAKGEEITAAAATTGGVPAAEVVPEASGEAPSSLPADIYIPMEEVAGREEVGPGEQH